MKAVAFYDGKGQSEITTCHYTIKTETRITALSSADMKVTPAHVRDAFEVVGVDGAFRVSVYSMTGKLLMKQEQVKSGQKVNAAALQTGVYLVVVNSEDDCFTQRIIKE